jgi:chemotaxis-related protein WspD
VTFSTPIAAAPSDCWNQIGVWGDGSCPELVKAVHCHNCPVFAAAGQRFLDAPPPGGYLEEWTERLLAPAETAATDVQSVLIFRLAEEWLALPVEVLVEVTGPRPVHTIPQRAGLLAGIVNIRGELQLCARLSDLLGIAHQARNGAPEPDNESRITVGRSASSAPGARMIVVERDGERWVFPVDQVEQVHRFPISALAAAPATLARAVGKLTRGIFVWRGRSIGYLDDARLFQALRARIQ